MKARKSSPCSDNNRVYFYKDTIIEGEKICVFYRATHERCKSWIFYVYTGLPTPSGRRVEVVHTSKTLTKSYWYYEFSGVAGDAKAAGIDYGTHCVKSPKTKEMPEYIFCVVHLLFDLPSNLIQRKEVKNGKEVGRLTGSVLAESLKLK